MKSKKKRNRPGGNRDGITRRYKIKYHQYYITKIMWGQGVI